MATGQWASPDWRRRSAAAVGAEEEEELRRDSGPPSLWWHGREGGGTDTTGPRVHNVHHPENLECPVHKYI